MLLVIFSLPTGLYARWLGFQAWGDQLKQPHLAWPVELMAAGEICLAFVLSLEA